MTTQERIQAITLLKEVLSVQVAYQNGGITMPLTPWTLEEINQLKELIFNNIKLLQ